MVAELKRRTSNFFPVTVDLFPGTSLGPSVSPNLELHQVIQRQQGRQMQTLDDAAVTSNRTPSLLSTPLFLSPEQSFSLNLFGVAGLSLSGLISPYATGLGDVSGGPPSAQISYSAPNILNDASFGRKLDFSLGQQLLNLGLEEPSHFRDLFSDQSRFSLQLESPTIAHRPSIWSMPNREDVHLFREDVDVLNLSLGPSSELLPPIDVIFEKKKPNSHQKRLKFLLESQTESWRTNSKDHTVNPLTASKPSESSQGSNRLKHDSKPKEKSIAKEPPRVAVKIKPTSDTLNIRKEEGDNLRTLCSRYVLRNLGTKVYPEDYCSTFYKRNKHGYMFIREASSSLKVNSSGPKSWVTIKLRLGKEDTKKLKVNVRNLPEWKPINLNLTFVPRKHCKSGHRNNSIEGGRRPRKPQLRG